MESKKKTVDVYLVAGKEFLNEDEALKFEEEINAELKYKFFTIRYSPDLTEGRGYYKTTTIAVPRNFSEYATVLQYCVNNFGKPLEFVQGCCPMANWVIHEEKLFNTIDELNEFKNSKTYGGVGDYYKSIDRKIIYLNDKGELDITKNSNAKESEDI